MSISFAQLEQVTPPEIATTLKNAGVAGAGGAGFPSHAKWERLDEVDHLLVNHQESEPNYYMDKWLLRERAGLFASFLDELLGAAFESVVVTPKLKDRAWTKPFEEATDATVFMPEELPIDPDRVSGVVIAYTQDKYEYGMESVLLRITADVVLGGNDLPMDEGWMVQNTETLERIRQALTVGEPVTRKFVHVGGDVPRHRFLDVPIGTLASDLLEAARMESSSLPADKTLVEGGPGWSFEIDASPEEFGVTKRTNAVMVLSKDDVEANTLGNGRVNVVNDLDWERDHETAPRPLEPDRVRIPLLSNADLESIVARAEPIVTEGERVESGEMIARPVSDGISNAHHAPVDGEVQRVTDEEIHLQTVSESAIAAARPATERGIYWTWCTECGSYAPMPEPDHVEGTAFVCASCR